MKANRHILLTFDYELFLGRRSGDVDSCMVMPVSLLQDIFDEYGIEKAIFFVDTTHLIKLQMNGNDEQSVKDFEKIKENVRFLLEKGHYIYPHIHPHWLDAKKEDNDWVLTNLKRYCFKNCSREEQIMIWKKSMSILKDFGVNNYHKIDAFRAGGWGIQPFSEFKPFFVQYSIKYDFTVMPGTSFWSEAQQYDFTSLIIKRPYRFEEKVTEIKKNGTYTEFPISVRLKTKRTLMEKIWLKYLWKSGNRSIGKGQGIALKKLDYIPENEPQKVEMISIELMHALNLRDYKNYLDSRDYMQFIAHPKMLSRHNLKIFRSFLKYAFQNYNLNFDFKSIETT